MKLACLAATLCLLLACGGKAEDEPAVAECCDYLWSYRTQLCYGRGNCPPGDDCECRHGPDAPGPGPHCVLYTSCQESQR